MCWHENTHQKFSVVNLRQANKDADFLHAKVCLDWC